MVTYKSTGVYLYNKYTLYFQSIFYVYIENAPSPGIKRGGRRENVTPVLFYEQE